MQHTKTYSQLGYNLWYLQLHPSQGENGPTVHSVQSLADAAASQGEITSVDFSNVTEAGLSQEGQIILTSEDGHGKYQTLCSQKTVGKIGRSIQISSRK